MNRHLLATSTLAAAVTLALVAQTVQVRAAETAVEKCYGINAQGKNDCKAGAHDCAGHATTARDPKSFVLVPQGACGKIAGGSTKSG